MTEDEKWSQRRLRHCKQYGIKTDVASEKLRSLPKIAQDGHIQQQDEEDANSRKASGFTGLSPRSTSISRTQSLDRSRVPSVGPLGSGMNGGKRESVLQMVCKGINSVANGDYFRHLQTNSSSNGRGHAATVSRIPTYISVRDRDRSLLGCSSSFAFNAHHHNSHGTGNSTTTTAIGSVQFNSIGTLELETPRYGGEMDDLLPSSTSAAASGEGTTSASNTQFYLHSQLSQQEPQTTMQLMDDYLDDDTIFDILFFDQQQQKGHQPIRRIDEPKNNNLLGRSRIAPNLVEKVTALNDGNRIVTDADKIGRSTGRKQKKRSKLQRFVGLFGGDTSEERITRLRSLAKFNFSIRRGGNQLRGECDETVERRTKLPIYGRFLSDPELIKKLKDDSCDYRPYFTYWISTVHVLVLLFMLLNYGIGTDFSNALFNPFGVIERSGDVMTSSLSAAHLVVWEQNNIWIGPKYADLVHAGAKYTPCMRRDAKIYERILQERRIEAETTGCCIGPWGCYQTSECPKQFAQLLKWLNGTFPDSQAYSRVVCGQDPRFCVRPRSVHPFLWGGTNISNWPICEQRPRSPIPSRERHMHCELTGNLAIFLLCFFMRPCCIQIHGQCRIASREYCDFVGGYYHSNATLCSQVSCLNEVCGMTPFLRRDHPDQIFRLITPLFIHAGIIRCAISLAIYLTIMRRFEIMIGWIRLSTIYFVSGIGGYLASAVFVPYMPEVGPVGSEGGILGALIINILYNWDMLSQPYRALAFHLTIAGCLFLLGFLPWIDNWAQLFGFIFGSLMAIVLIPYITIGPSQQQGGGHHRRLSIVVASLCVTVALFAILFLLFFAWPINFAALGLLNCPIPSKICDHQGLILRNWLPI